MISLYSRRHGWDNLQDWNAVTDGYVLFWKDRSASRGSEVALYVREQLQCISPCLGMNDEQVESLWVRLRARQTGVAHCGCLLPAA